jgi:hypothetical protein
LNRFGQGNSLGTHGRPGCPFASGGTYNCATNAALCCATNGGGGWGNTGLQIVLTARLGLFDRLMRLLAWF